MNNEYFYNPYMYGHGRDGNDAWQDAGYYYGYRQVSIEEAMQIALRRVPGQVVKVELDRENGAWVYEVDIITSQGVKYEVEVDISTGDIVKVEVDR